MIDLHPTTFESVQQAHLLLMENLRQLEEIVRAGTETNMQALRSLLSTTYSHVCEHFRLEEKEGFTDETLRRQPRLLRIAEELFEEHRDMRQKLDSLHGEANMASRLNFELRNMILAWIKQIRRHEIRENDLIQDAMDSDIGTQD
jgi:hypothetical protein